MASDGDKRLFIGDVTALTGISAGRIRHYEDAGLIELHHIESGYRTFGAGQLRVLLQIDILRGLGIGLAEIRTYLKDPEQLPQLLSEHRAALERKRTDLDLTIAKLDQALLDPDGKVDPDRLDPHESSDEPKDEDLLLLTRLAASSATTHLGLVGRLEKPLSSETGDLWSQLFKGHRSDSIPLFGQLVVPGEVTDCMEALAGARGHQELIHRLFVLGQDLRAVPPGDTGRAEALADRWVDQQDCFPLDTAIIDVLDSYWPELSRLPFCRVGLYVWASAQSKAGAAFFLGLESAARERGGRMLGTLFIPGR